MINPSPRIAPLQNSWSVRMADTMLKLYKMEDAKWHYEHGLLMKALYTVGLTRGDERYLSFVEEWVDQFVTAEGGIRSYRLEELNLDQINPGKLFFPFYQRTGEDRYCLALKLLRTQLKHQPRTPSGGFWHKQIYPNQMWLDGIYMAGPFYAQYGLVFDEPAIFDDVAHQILLVEQHTRDPKSGLLYHAWDESRQQRWANPETGCSPHFWGRAIGWFAMALVDVLDYLPEAHPDYLAVVACLKRLAQALVKVQDKSTGLWYQVVDLACRPKNYREASASAMLAYAFAKGVRKGFLAMEYLSAAQRAYHGLLSNHIQMDVRGSLTLEGTCGVGGLGGNPYRDGSFEYYVGEKIITNDFKGVGPFILAALEMEAVEANAPIVE